MPTPVTFAKLDIWNQVLTGLGEPLLTSLAGSSKPHQVLSQHYDATVQAAMTETSWRFATAKRALNKLSGAPTNRWAAAWNLPVDNLKVLTTWPPGNYELQNRQLLTNEQTRLEIDYIRLVEEGFWPAWFTVYVVARLVVITCKGITREDPSAEMREILKTAETKALVADAQQQPNQTIQSNEFVDCRN